MALKYGTYNNKNRSKLNKK